MLERGDLGTPFFNGRPFLLKPVLIYWLIAAAFRLLGETEFAARVGSAFLGTAIVLLTYWFGTKMLSRRAGLFAGLAVALSYMWIDIARDASIDIPLTAALTPALFLLFWATRAPAGRKRRLYLAAYPLFGLALLAKGPVPVGVVLLGWIAYLLGARRFKTALAEAQLLPGLVLMLLVAAPWYIYEWLHQPAFINIFFIGEHFGHLHGTLARTEPWWGHLKNLLVFFYPWVVFLPAAIAYALGRHSRDHVLRFAAWWTIAVVAAFSVPQAKLPHYLAIAFPALGLLVGGWLDAWLQRQAISRWGSGLALGLLATLGLICLAAAVAGPLLISSGRLPAAKSWPPAWTPGWAPVIMLAALGAGSLLAALAGLVKKRAVVPILVTAMIVAGFAHVGWFKLRIADIQAQPRKELAVFASTAVGAAEPLGVFYAKRNSTIFYARRPIEDLGEWEPDLLVDFLSSHEPAVALTHESFLPLLRDSGVQIFVWRQRGQYLLVANHPPGERPPEASDTPRGRSLPAAPESW